MWLTNVSGLAGKHVSGNSDCRCFVCTRIWLTDFTRDRKIKQGNSRDRLCLHSVCCEGKVHFNINRLFGHMSVYEACDWSVFPSLLDPQLSHPPVCFLSVIPALFLLRHVKAFPAHLCTQNPETPRWCRTEITAQTENKSKVAVSIPSHWARSICCSASQVSVQAASQHITQRRDAASPSQTRREPVSRVQGPWNKSPLYKSILTSSNCASRALWVS